MTWKPNPVVKDEQKTWVNLSKTETINPETVVEKEFPEQMTVNQFFKLLNVNLHYASDRKMARVNGENPVLAYYICTSKDRYIKSHAFLFRTDRLIVGIVNGQRVEPNKVLKIIRTMKMSIKDLDDKTVEKELFAGAI